MNEDDVKSFVAEFIKNKDAEPTVRAVKYVSDRMELTKALCDRLFGSGMATIQEIYSMYDILNREASTQILVMATEKVRASASEQLDKASEQLGVAKDKVKPDGDLN